jgi:hypothetical protein
LNSSRPLVNKSWAKPMGHAHAHKARPITRQISIKIAIVIISRLSSQKPVRVRRVVPSVHVFCPPSAISIGRSNRRIGRTGDNQYEPIIVRFNRITRTNCVGIRRYLILKIRRFILIEFTPRYSHGATRIGLVG